MFSEADKRLAERAAKQHSVFTIADARAAGLSNDQITRRRSGRGPWQVLYQGVYMPAGISPSWEARALAACLAAGYVPADDDADPPVPAVLAAGISHRSGAEYYGLPVLEIDELEITCKRWDRACRTDVIVHESTAFEEGDIEVVDGIPVFIPEVVVTQLASLRPNPNYVEAVIQAARRKRLITYESMLPVVCRFAQRGRPGTRAMRCAMERWNPASRATQSEMETLLVQALRDAGLPEPVPQYDIYDDNGLWVASVDAGLPDWKIALDYDSKQEHSDEFQLARDATRRNKIVASGYTFLVARHRDLLNGGHQLCEDIRSVIRRRSARPTQPA